jgi:hypothetical protein
LQNKKLNKEVILQIAIKAINDIARPDKLMPTLLVFKSYPKIINQDPLAPTITKRAKAICIAIKEVQRFYTEYQVQEALATRNKPITNKMHNLLL